MMPAGRMNNMTLAISMTMTIPMISSRNSSNRSYNTGISKGRGIIAKNSPLFIPQKQYLCISESEEHKPESAHLRFDRNNLPRRRKKKQMMNFQGCQGQKSFSNSFKS
jgi:hypothetical protein